MAYLPRRHQVLKNGTITTGSNSGALQNLGRSANPTIVAFLDVQNAPTGTSPQLTVSVYGSMDGVRYSTSPIASFTAVTAQMTGPQRIVLQNALDPYFFVVWTVSGTTPSFTGVYIDLLMTAPDA